MAVQLRRDEQIEVQSKRHDPEMDRADLAAGVVSGVIASVTCLVPAVILLALGVRLLKRALVAAEKLRADMGGDFWQESFMPNVLFIIFGAVFGALVGWRIHAKASLTPVISWVLGGSATILLAVAGSIAASTIFTGAIPGTCWMGLVLMAAASLVAFRFT